MRKLKKGFTIIELVIVIAVIAVLTAVLVPTFVHLSKKARDTNDKSVVTSANIQLAAQEGLQGKNRSMSEAVKDVDEIGYHMSTVPTGNGNKIVWDSVTDRFVLLDKDNNVLLSDGEVSSHDKLFYPVSSISEAGDFAIYAKSNFDLSVVNFSSAKSFDAGEKVPTVGHENNYIESISYAFNDAGNVLVVTNSQETEVTVNTPNAEFAHTGLSKKILITAVAADTFKDFGHVGYVEINAGHYVADAGADIKAVYATSENAKVDTQNGGKIGKAYGGAETYTGDNSKGNVELDFNENKVAVEEQALEDLDHEINPQPALVGTAISDENWQDTLPAGDYYLSKDFEIKNGSHGLHFADDATVKLNLNGHTIRLTASGYEPYCIYTDGGNLTIFDSSTGGAIVNDSDEEDARGIYGIYATISVEGGTINGSNPKSIGCLGSAINMYIKPGTVGGLIFADSPTGFVNNVGAALTLHESGTFKVTCEGLQYGIESLQPTVKDKNGNTVNPNGGKKTYTGGFKYYEYVIA